MALSRANILRILQPYITSALITIARARNWDVRKLVIEAQTLEELVLQVWQSADKRVRAELAPPPIADILEPAQPTRPIPPSQRPTAPPPPPMPRKNPWRVDAKTPPRPPSRDDLEASVVDMSEAESSPEMPRAKHKSAVRALRPPPIPSEAKKK